LKYLLSFVNHADEISAFEKIPEQMRAKALDRVVSWGERYANRVVAAEPLTPPSAAKVVRFSDRFGDPASAMVTDGPFVESKEIFQGFCLIEAADDEEAIEIAKEWPGSRIVEIRATAPRLTRPVESGARAVADLVEGKVLASVELRADPQRVFRTLASPDVTSWWMRPGIFDTREWHGDVREGGRWMASGVARGKPYALEGEFLEIESGVKLVHTWQVSGADGAPTAVTYLLQPSGNGTRLTLRHEGFTSPQACEGTAIGWETSFQRLAEMLSTEAVPV
jgi:uncharacterized protein YndB with AHSA1/START domain